MFIEVLTSSKARNQHRQVQKRNKSLCLLQTAVHHGTYLPLLVCMSCKPNSTVVHTITDGQMGGTGPPKLNLVDNRRLF